MADQSVPDAKQKKEIRAREGVAALATYHAEQRAIDAKTARLRAARLAREAAETVSPKAAVKTKTARKKAQV